MAAIQLACEPNRFDQNTAKAEAFIQQAVDDGAQLLLLPELTTGGYTLTEAIWDSAEPFDGPTLKWLVNQATRFAIHIGTTFLEAEGEDFYNTFVLVAPDGTVAGKVRKNPPASFEAWFFTSGDWPHWFDTTVGRIGVGICLENALYQRYVELHNADIDLLLRPFSGASFEAKFPIRRRDVELINGSLQGGTADTARQTGRPVLMANKVGRLVTDLPGGFPKQDVEFPGYSAIADGDGRLLGQLGPGQEGIVVGTVQLDPARKKREQAPNRYGRWTVPLPWWAFLWTLTQRMGERAYTTSRRRRARATAISSRNRG